MFLYLKNKLLFLVQICVVFMVPRVIRLQPLLLYNTKTLKFFSTASVEFCECFFFNSMNHVVFLFGSRLSMPSVV